MQYRTLERLAAWASLDRQGLRTAQMKSLEKVYADLLSASAGEISFERTIETITDWFDAGGGLIFEMNRKTGEILDWATPTLLVGGDGYDEHLNSINPRMHFSLRHAPGHVAYEGRFISERGMDRHEFYDWLRQYDLRYMLGSRLYDDGDISLFHSLEFTTKHGHPGNDKIEAFRRLAPAVGNAWRLRKRVKANGQEDTASAWLPDHLPWSIFALSSTGALSGMNASARAMLAKGDVVQTVDGALHAAHRSSDTAFRQAVRSALSGYASDTLIQTGSGGPPLIAQVFPANGNGVDTHSRCAALVYIRDTLEKSPNVGVVLGRLYGFTPAEQKLANLLAAGSDLTAAAETLGLSRNTVRNRMQSMHAKSGTRRQSEFLIKILGILKA